MNRLPESFQYLNLCELAAIGNICSRFNQIAQTHFQF